MIIKQKTLRTGSGPRIAKHVLKGEENEEIIVLEGGEGSILSGDDIARHMGRKNSIFHGIISWAGEMTDAQIAAAVDAVLEEYKIDRSTRSVTAVLHTKPRESGEENERHIHILASLIDDQGKTLSDSHAYPRNEYIARKLEIQFGHEITPGKFNRIVRQRFIDDGDLEGAAKLDAACEVPRPKESYSTESFQNAKQKGIDLAGLRVAMLAGGDLTSIAEQNGVKIFRGEKHWMLSIPGQKDKSLSRFLKIKPHEISTTKGEKYYVSTSTIDGNASTGKGLGQDRSSEKRHNKNSESVRRTGTAGGSQPIGNVDAENRRSRLEGGPVAGHSAAGNGDRLKRPDKLKRPVFTHLESELFDMKHQKAARAERPASTASIEIILRSAKFVALKYGWNSPESEIALNMLRDTDLVAYIRMHEAYLRGDLGRLPATRDALRSYCPNAIFAVAIANLILLILQKLGLIKVEELKKPEPEPEAPSPAYTPKF